MQTTFTAASTQPHQPTAARQQLRAARRRNRELTESRIAAKIERTNQLLEGAGGWESDIYQMLDRLSSWQADIGGQTFAGLGYGGFASTINDRRYGKDFPIYQTEVDLQVMRFASRLLLATNGYAIGMLEGITSYVIADGFTQEVKERQGHQDEVDPALLDKLNEVLDNFRDENDWHGGEQPGLEEEIFQRGEEDGETGLCLYEDDAGCCYVNTIEPEQITAAGHGGQEWLFGILVDSNSQRPTHYNIRGMQTDEAGEVYEAAQIVHYKTNVKRQMKRGIPSFSFGVADTLRLADNLRGQMGRGAGKQAGIAGVRQWDNATATQVQGFKAAFEAYGQTDLQGRPAPRGGPTDVAFEDIPKGMQWVNPPNATNAPAHVQILQACLRGATARWNAPEWIGSGDAGNNGFAGALVVDAPFTKRVIRVQRRQEAIQKRIFTWALNCRCERQGMITAVRQDGTVVSKPWAELKRLVEVVVTAPSVEVRNKLEEAQANQIRVQGGWKSLQTVQAEESLDSEREFTNIDDRREQTATMPGMPMPGDPNGLQPSPGGNSGEPRSASTGTPKPPAFTEGHQLRLDPAHVTLLEAVSKQLLEFDEHKIKRADDGRFGSGGGGASKEPATKEPEKKEPAKTTGASVSHEDAAHDAASAIEAGEAEIADEVKPGGRFHELSVSVAAKVVNIVKGLINSEAPVWACETCDLWMFENAMNQAGGSGSVMAVKVAGIVACKSYMLARGLLNKIKGGPKLEAVDAREFDLQAVAKQIHEAMQEIGLAAGFAVPSFAKLRDQLKERAGAAVMESHTLVRLAESIPTPIVNVPAPIINVPDNSDLTRLVMTLINELPKAIAHAVKAAMPEQRTGPKRITIEKDADGRWTGETS